MKKNKKLIFIIEMLKKIKKIFRKSGLPKGLASYPYISGDTFLCFASKVFVEEKGKLFVKEKIKKNNNYFIEADLFNKYDLNKILVAGDRLIIHNGDSNPCEKKLLLLASEEIFIFGTNIKINNIYVSCIPIGIENAHWNKNGAINYYNGNLNSKNQKKKTNIFMSFSVSTNQERRGYYEKIAMKYGLKNILGLNLRRYREQLTEAMFVLSPPGNGIDCHRTWEAIYHGCIPVVEREDWLFEAIELPVLVVNELENFFQLTVKERENLYFKLLEKDNSAAFFDYWVGKIDNSLNNKTKMN